MGSPRSRLPKRSLRRGVSALSKRLLNGMNAIQSATIPSTSSRSSFGNEWDRLFGKSPSFEQLQRICYSGKLRDSRLRSVIWRVLLNVLPVHTDEWPELLHNRRHQYDKIKRKLTTNPRSDNFVANPTLNNPLGLQSENPWQQFFADEELRDCIKKDVDRTFPELQFFQSKPTQIIMSDILFVYAKQNNHISYRQGMHEILAPLLFAIYFDHRAFEHVVEMDGLSGLSESDVKVLKVVNNPDFLEHDAFALFEQLMMMLEGWYMNDDEEEYDQKVANAKRRCDGPFSKSVIAPNSMLLRRLDYINDELLSLTDPMLYRHLRALEISPQIFGIRWLRLLFGREFPIHDLLFLWDVILADRPQLELVDYIFQALLLQIRELLLDGDYSMTLQYLMRYPPTADIHSFIQFSLHLKDPQKHPKPKTATIPLFSHLTLAGKAHPNRERSRPSASGGGAVAAKQRKPVDIVLNKLGRQALSASSSPLARRRDVRSNNAVSVVEPNGMSAQNAAAALSANIAEAERTQRLRCAVDDFNSQCRDAERRLLGVAADLDRHEPLSAEAQMMMALELRSVATSLQSAVMRAATTTEPPAPASTNPSPTAAQSVLVPLKERSPSALKSTTNNDDLQPQMTPRRESLSQKNEMVEMSFSRKGNF